MIHFKTDRGIVGTASWNFAGATAEDLITIDGTNGQILLSTFGDDLIVKNSDGVEHVEISDPPHVQQPLIQMIVNELLGRGGTCPSTGVGAGTHFARDRLSPGELLRRPS